MKPIRLLATLALVASTAATGAAVANERPLADAGLDQTTTRGTTVYLDAGGSRDPDGTIAAYNWTIRTPSGGTTSPNCGHCERTNFRADAVGTFEVTLTATDDDGATATDTLYVEATPGSPPDISLAGPTRTTAGEPANVTATVDAGAAPLDRIEWVVDGATETTTSVNGTAASASHTVRFPTTGTHDIRAIAVDADGQQTESTHSITVAARTDPTDEATGPAGDIEPPTTAGPPTDNTSSNGDSNDENTLEPGPEIVGPQVVTGEPPLTATYRVTNAAAAEWVLDGDLTTKGTTIISPTLASGYHRLYAMPRGGGIATFSDNTRTIVADPAPNVHLERVVEESVVTVDAYATDDLENLRSLTVLVDGEPMETTTTGGFQRYTDGDQLTTITRLSTLSPGDHTVTVRATDARGQTDTESEEIHVPGPPEVVSAGFVNPEPLSVYHPKLDPEEYTADFRVEIDLNGVKPGRISKQAGSAKADKIASTRSYVKSTSNLVIETDFDYLRAERISASQKTVWERGRNRVSLGLDKGSTVYSETRPIIRLDMVKAQNEAGKMRASVFDASGSFDPDKSRLRFRWVSSSGRVKKGPQQRLSALEVSELRVEDGQEQKNTTSQILDWFVPDFGGAKVISGDIHSPEDNVIFKVWTADYEIAKPTYTEYIDYSLKLDNGVIKGKYADKERIAAGESDDIANRPGADSYIIRGWKIAVPAERFLDGSQTVELQADNEPESSRTMELPSPTILQPIKTRSQVMELNREFLVRNQDYDVRETSNPKVRDALEAAGYEVHNVENTGTAYQLEKRVKTQSAKFEQKHQEFTTKREFEYFLGTHPSWNRDGSKTETRSRTVTETEWRNLLVRNTRFTGDTRRVKTESAEYRTEYEYRYEQTETYKTEETFKKTIEQTVTVTDTIKQCGVIQGCTEREVEVEETVKETVERTREVTKSYTTTERYWSSRPRGFGHQRTGNRRSIKVEDAVYKTQYKYRVERTETYTERVYIADTVVKVQSDEYEWQPYDTVTNKISKSMLTSPDNIRVSHKEATKEWTLRQEDGAVRRWIDQISSPEGVIKTNIEVSVKVKTVLRDPRDGLLDTTIEKERTERLGGLIEEYITRNEAKKYTLEKSNRTHAGYE